MTKKQTDHRVNALLKEYPLLEQIIALEPLFWENPSLTSVNALSDDLITLDNVKNADQLWKRFAPFLEEVFPVLKALRGKIESPLIRIDQMKEALSGIFDITMNHLWLKGDHALPVAGSIKARGGFYEVLYFAEQLAKQHHLLDEMKDYRQFQEERFKQLFRKYTIGVGSTGNLALSIGFMGRALGFNVSVYMSHDAKQWKKDLLRNIGAKVHEYEGDFSEAIAEGRRLTTEDAYGYFVDDEDSKRLFLGYGTAAFHFKEQLEAEGIHVGEDEPLFLYLPCGVGGSPGGITIGVKHLLGDHVHCFFVEPTRSPSHLIGLLTGKKDGISVQDIGLDNVTEADGLAVGRSSAFATTFNELLISGIYTIDDQSLFDLLKLLKDTEDIFLEPSATAGLFGPMHVLRSDYCKKHHIDPANVHHVVWATGGDLVPEEERKEFYNRGESLTKG